MLAICLSCHRCRVPLEICTHLQVEMKKMQLHHRGQRLIVGAFGRREKVRGKQNRKVEFGFALVFLSFKQTSKAIWFVKNKYCCCFFFSLFFFIFFWFGLFSRLKTNKIVWHFFFVSRSRIWKTYGLRSGSLLPYGLICAIDLFQENKEKSECSERSLQKFKSKIFLNKQI